MTGVKWVVGDVLQSSVSDRYKFPATFLKGARQDGVLALEAFPHLNGLAISSWTAFQGMKEWSQLSFAGVCRYSVVTDKGTFDAIGLSEDGQSKQALYIRCVHSLLQPGGLLIITSCNSTLQELVSRFTAPSEAAATASDTVAVDHEARSASLQPSSLGVSRACTVFASSRHEGCGRADTELKRKGCVDTSGMSNTSRAELHPCQRPAWVYADHVRTYRVFSFGGYEGSKVCTVAFRRADDIHRL